MTQIDLNGEVFTDCKKDEIKKEETRKRFIKKAKRERQLKDVNQRRLSGERISSEVIKFHKGKDSRKKANMRKNRKLVEENARRVEQTILF